MQIENYKYYLSIFVLTLGWFILLVLKSKISCYAEHHLEKKFFIYASLDSIITFFLTSIYMTYLFFLGFD